ncbi:hypothetical protein A9Q98_06630 [Thalassotalea sp. 42_200_T64]|nr:hypothetical protein A9Q98_06630 [Thalassotalea sp. 42_200_T64]
MTTANINRRAKGEKTRHKILTAAIKVIARSGIKGTTHRAVALQAETQLSLTTYYFKDIKELIREAISLSSEIILASSRDELSEVFNILDSLDAASLRKISTKEKIGEQLSHIAASHMYDNIVHRSTGLAVEQIFFTEMLYSEELKDLANQHISALLAPFTRIASYFNKVDPEIDGELTLIAITRIQYKYLATPKEEVKFDDIHKLIRRQISWLLGIKRQ